MPDFAHTQARIRQARANFEAAQSALDQARRDLATRLREQATFSRRSRTVGNRFLRFLSAENRAAAKMQGAVEAAGEKTKGSQAAVDAALKAMQDAAKGFAPFLDPRKNLSNWSSDSPIALLPVRIETRFAIGQGDPPTNELWVRVYPDDCWIDTFEPNLSASELDNAKRYWRGVWRAGGIEADRRAAWRSLATAHGGGRAGFIVDTYQPSNLQDLPKNRAPTEVILVIPTQTPLDDPEREKFMPYWKAVWLADGDATRTDAAKAELERAVGSARAAQLIQDYVPFNLDDAPIASLAREDVTLRVSFMVLPEDPTTSLQSWTQAPRVRHFPDCFVVLGFSGGMQTLSFTGSQIKLPLYVGPDPEADPMQSIHPDAGTGDLYVPDQLKWLVDFQKAVDAGMGLKIPLSNELAQNGFDRLLVFGVQLSSNAVDGQLALTELLQHHTSGRSGLAVLAQGTPAHNTTGNSSGYGRLEDPDRSFDDRDHAPLFTLTNDPLAKRDGQWLAEALGVSPSVFYNVHGADGMDQAQARAMQRALWPSTLGYWMDKLLAPLFSDETLESTRWYLTNFVSGRGAVPPIRIGGQPYGILPTTAFSRIGWLDKRSLGPAGLTPSQQGFLIQLYGVIKGVDPDWTALSKMASYVGKNGDAHQILLDIIGLHPDSAEFHSRYAESVEQVYNTLNLAGFGPQFMAAIMAAIQRIGGAQLLAQLGYSGRQLPEILNQLFDSAASPISTVIDDVASSETAPIRNYTVDGHNYLHWLLDAAKTSLDSLRTERGFSGNQTPQALLYLYLRQALMLGYFDTSYELHKSAGFLAPQALAAMKPEVAFVHVDPEAPASESRFAALYKEESRITGSNVQLVSDYITAHYAGLPEAANFADQLASLAILENAPTAALERLFSEHIDLCSYRFDSWLLGLAHLRLSMMRNRAGRKENQSGVYIAAYAWVENVRPSQWALTSVRLPPDLKEAFSEDRPIMQDASNGGYIHAPSIPHARTAAVLRSGYLANASAQNPKTLSVNLSSDRVRLALSILEGIRNGQSLGALLGYRFERGLHDDHNLAEVDRFIYPLRLAFPLVAGAIDSTPIPDGTSIQAVEARNVLDGRKLIEQIQSSNRSSYPFGLNTLPPANAVETAAINAEANRLLDAYDAVADLALAEGVHQAVQGNFERIAATLDAYSSGNFPPDPEVVQTPLRGIGLTHRVAVHFRPGRTAPAGATPRAIAEPGLDDWLGRMFPDLGTVVCTVTWRDVITQAAKSRVVALADLGLRPIDVVALVRPDSSPAMTELDDRVWSYVLAQDHPRPDTTLKIEYATGPAGAISVFAVSALVRSLSALITRARPLRPSDTLLGSDATGETDGVATVARGRIADVLAMLQTLGTDLDTFVNQLSALVPDPMPNPIPPAILDAIVQQIDALIDKTTKLLERAARFGLPQAGWGHLLGWKRNAFADLLSAVKDLVERWDKKLADYDAKLTAYDALPAGTSDADRFKALRAAEMTISTLLVPLPATPAALRAIIQGKATNFTTRRDQFNALLTTNDALFKDLLNAIGALLPISSFDAANFDIGPFQTRVIVIAQDLVQIFRGQQGAVAKRRDATQAAFDAADNAASVADQTAALQTAAKALLGEDVVVCPEFPLDTAQAAEWTNAYAASGDGGSLLKYLYDTAKIDFPLDEWLSGVARVRPAMHAWEAVLNLTNALGVAEPALRPVQFPFEADAPWIAMQFPNTYRLASDRLLYTAHYPPGGFDATQSQCGLLLDQWSEQVPVKDDGADALYRDTAITFHYDRPNSEAPQSILLVTPASASAQWQWQDLVAALNDTLDLAKKRALEPVHLEQKAYASFLPATVMAATLYGISITTSLAAANGVFKHIRSD